MSSMNGEQSGDQAAVLRVVAVLLPERPHRVDLLGDRVVGKGVGGIERYVVPLERIAGRHAAARLDGRQDALAVVVGVEGLHHGFRHHGFRRRTLATWARSRATSAWLNAALVSIWTCSGRSVRPSCRAVSSRMPSKPIASVISISLPAG